MNVLRRLFIIIACLAIHELGHLAQLTRLNLEAEEFSLGAGPQLLHYSTDFGLSISLRLIPFMAYVKPSEQAKKSLENATLTQKCSLYFAGIRNNIFALSIALVSLQIAGWRMKTKTTRQVAREIVLILPYILLRSFALFVGVATNGYLNLTRKFTFSTGGLTPPRVLYEFILINLVLVNLNLAPLPGLDGGRILQSIFKPMEYLSGIGWPLAILFLIWASHDRYWDVFEQEVSYLRKKPKL